MIILSFKLIDCHNILADDIRTAINVACADHDASTHRESFVSEINPDSIQAAFQQGYVFKKLKYQLETLVWEWNSFSGKEYCYN